MGGRIWRFLWQQIGNVLRWKTILELLGWWKPLVAFVIAFLIAFRAALESQPWSIRFLVFLVAFLVVMTILVLAAEYIETLKGRPRPPKESQPDRRLHQETHGPNSPAIATTGDHSPITFHAAPAVPGYTLTVPIPDGDVLISNIDLLGAELQASSAW